MILWQELIREFHVAAYVTVDWSSSNPLIHDVTLYIFTCVYTISWINGLLVARQIRMLQLS